MHHIAIDLGGTESQVCIRDERGEVLKEEKRDTPTLGVYLGKLPKSRVVFETCAEAFKLADEAMAAGHEVRVVPSVLVHALGVGARGIKTDRRDAQALSQASCRMDLPSVHVPSAAARERKAKCGMRESMVESRTKLINTLRGWMRTQGLALRGGAANTFAKRLREKLMKLGSVPVDVEDLLAVIEALNTRIVAGDQRLAAEAMKDDVCRRLMTVPGVGPVTAVRFVAAVDDVSRFANAHVLQSYLGLTPGERSSSNRQQRTHLTKAGAPRLRRVLVQAAWCAARTARAQPMVRWKEQVELRRGKKVAVIALARKLAGIMYALWRDGSTYKLLHRPTHEEATTKR